MTLDVTAMMAPLFWGMTAILLVGGAALALGRVRGPGHGNGLEPVRRPAPRRSLWQAPVFTALVTRRRAASAVRRVHGRAAPLSS
jgi:hypothetical protein